MVIDFLIRRYDYSYGEVEGVFDGEGMLPNEDPKLAIAKANFDKIRIIGLRFFNVFGPREGFKGKPASMIYHLRNQMMKGNTTRLFKFGEQKRDHIYVKDAVDATMIAVNAKSGIYNVGTGIATTFNDLIKVLNIVLKKNSEPETLV